MCAKNYEKLFRVDKVITTHTMYGFFGPPCKERRGADAVTVPSHQLLTGILTWQKCQCFHHVACQQLQLLFGSAIISSQNLPSLSVLNPSCWRWSRSIGAFNLAGPITTIIYAHVILINPSRPNKQYYFARRSFSFMRLPYRTVFLQREHFYSASA